MSFSLHPNFDNKIFIADLALCRVLLENESNYPWILLVPRREGKSRVMDLDQSDQWQLMQEMNLAQNVLWRCFNPKQINIAAIGNKTPQLHVHVIARFENDPAWPYTVWDHPDKRPYTLELKKQRISQLQAQFSKK